MKRRFATIVGIVVACLMAGLLGAIAVTGRWPVDAQRTHVETGGILAFPAKEIARVEFSAGEQRSLFSRDPREGWLFNGAPTGPAVADHIDTAARLLLVSAPRRVLAGGEYSDYSAALQPRFRGAGRTRRARKKRGEGSRLLCPYPAKRYVGDRAG